MIKEVMGIYRELHDNHIDKTYTMLRVWDEESTEEAMCMQVYSSKGKIIESIGFKYGPIVNHKGGMIMGHKLMSVSTSDKKKMAEVCKNIPALAPVVEVVEVIEKPVRKIREAK